jgi:hypothetical protein
VKIGSIVASRAHFLEIFIIYKLNVLFIFHEIYFTLSFISRFQVA